MSKPLLSVLIPTIGRETLPNTLESIKRQELHSGDEILVLADGHLPRVEALVACMPSQFHYIELFPEPHYNWGHPLRNRMMFLAKGDYLLHQDDDDVYTPNAFATIRSKIAERPGLPHMFRMVRTKDSRALLWHTRTLAEGNVSSQMFAHPNQPDTFGVWTNRYGGDYDFFQATVDKWPAGALVWHEDIVCIKDYKLINHPVDSFLRYYQYPCERVLPEKPHISVSVLDSSANPFELSLLIHRRSDGRTVIDRASFRYERSNAILIQGGLFVELVESLTVNEALLIHPQDLVSELVARASTSPTVAGVDVSGMDFHGHDQMLAMAALPVEAFRKAVSRI
jgi:glycosyltransferase involved in cell wall biosynthesis